MRAMNQRLKGIFLAFLTVICIVSAVSISPVSAADVSRIADFADLLSDSEEADLSYLLDEISERQQVDLVVITVDSLEGEPAMAYADDFYDYNGYGFGDGRDGILLLISMEEREWYISTSGYGITALTDAGREYISEMFVDDLGVGDYAAAFTGFANLCDDFITQARTGEPYDAGNLPREPFSGWNFVTAFAIAFVMALIVTGIMRGQLKTIQSRSGADNYIKQGSMQLTKKNDLFLYRHIERRKRTENNNSDSPGGSRTHTSSSGETHGGGGGKF